MLVYLRSKLQVSCLILTIIRKEGEGCNVTPNTHLQPSQIKPLKSLPRLGLIADLFQFS